MRKLLFLGAAVLVAAPVLAQPTARNNDPVHDAPMPQAMADDEDWDDEDDGRGDQGRYNDGRYDQGRYDQGRGAPPIVQPGQVEAMGGAMDRLVGAVMSLPIGGIAAAVDPYNRGGIHPNATVRDMATRDDPYAEERMRAGIRGATRGVGAMGQALARAMPVLERSIREVEREMEAAMDQVDRGPR
jgi:hypothetical protein